MQGQWLDITMSQKAIYRLLDVGFAIVDIDP